jgi:hypothetical protein
MSDAFNVSLQRRLQVALLSPILRDLVVLDGVGTHDAPLLLPKQACTMCCALGALFALTAALAARCRSGQKFCI